MKPDPLWTGLALVGALNARIGGGLLRDAGGVSIDTRTLEEGDLFFAIKGGARDGHEFVRAAFEKGAAAAVVDESHVSALSGSGPLYIVKDVEAALERLGAYARARTNAYVAAITGSVGKTSTKDMARALFSRFGATHASAASYNNHWGVPLSLARMPAATNYGLFEIGMNHAGEIDALVRQVQPHVAVVTRVAAAHLEYFASLEAIADAKAEIFHGLLEGGVAIINRDDETYERLSQAAQARQIANVISFGSSSKADARLVEYETQGAAGVASAEIFGRRVDYRLNAPGLHVAQNALAVLLIAYAFGLELEPAAAALADFTPSSGRGEREELSLDGGTITLIDESYNANPASMRAALELLAATQPGPGGRRIAALGDMLELGARSAELHAELAEDLVRANVDLLFTAGPYMARAFYATPEKMLGAHRPTSAELAEPWLAALRPGDVAMVKGSNGSRMGVLVNALRNKRTSAAAADKGR
jgi:UDP-N-acetylmuramoyl-tripeptide--D-alanyl-D-alanine ligase